MTTDVRSIRRIFCAFASHLQLLLLLVGGLPLLFPHSGIAVAEPPSPSYDVIIAGSGPGGLVAAEYLSRDPNISVLVLEAGGPSLQASSGAESPAYAKSNGWTIFDIPGEYDSIAFQSSMERYRVDWIASPYTWLGKLVGGCSSLNGALYFQPPDAYVAESQWPFSPQEIDRGFQEIQKLFGWTYNPSPDGKWYLQEAFDIVGSALRARGYQEKQLNEKADRNAKSKSYGHPPYAIKDGLRDAPAKTFLSAMKDRPNFKLLTFATVSFINQSQGVSSGVTFLENGKLKSVNLSSRGVVIMAAGALSTPKILIQSGIGPEDQLKLLRGRSDFPGIPSSPESWVTNENVGKSIFDTAIVIPTFQNPAMKAFIYGQRPQWAIDQYVKQNQSGPWANPDPVLIAYENYDVNNRPYQFQLTVLPHGVASSSSNPQAFSVPVYINNPTSRDFATFRADGKWYASAKNSLYLSTKDDFDAMVSYLTKLREILSSTGSTPLNPMASQDVRDWLNANKGMVTNHFGGSCYTSSEESDKQRCSDDTFRVIGTKNIFLADASLMKEGTVNPYGFIMYIGHQAGVNVKKAMTGQSSDSSGAGSKPNSNGSQSSSSGSSSQSQESPSAPAKKLSIGAIVGITLAIVAYFGLLAALMIPCIRRSRKAAEELQSEKEQPTPDATATPAAEDGSTAVASFDRATSSV